MIDVNASTAARVMSAESDEWTVEQVQGQELRGFPRGTVQVRAFVAWTLGSSSSSNAAAAAGSIGKRKAEGHHLGQG